MLFSFAGLAAAAAPVLWLVMKEYQRDRVRTFLNPEADPLGHGWNIIQSKIAVGSGGLTGKGWLNGTQSNLEFIPERHTDFILAVLSEEFGLIGVSVLMLVYLMVIARGLYIASIARDTGSRLLAGALSLTLFVYVLVNGGMVSGVLPVVGVPLTTDQLWRYLCSDIVGRFRHDDVHLRPQKIHTIIEPAGCSI